MLGLPKDTLLSSLQKGLQLAFKEHIEANAVFINKDFYKKDKTFMKINSNGICEVPSMILGLEAHITTDLPDKFAYAILQKPGLTQADLIERAKYETRVRVAQDIIQTILSCRTALEDNFEIAFAGLVEVLAEKHGVVLKNGEIYKGEE